MVDGDGGRPGGGGGAKIIRHIFSSLQNTHPSYLLFMTLLCHYLLKWDISFDDYCVTGLLQPINKNTCLKTIFSGWGYNSFTPNFFVTLSSQ